MKKRCPNCRTINFPHARECVRCRASLSETPVFQEEQARTNGNSVFFRRALVCLAVCFFTLLGFYYSLVFTSKSLSRDEKATIEKAVRVLDEKGFSKEVFLLRHLTNYRGNDNWLNASTKFENAYAATNYPLEIMTVYPIFFTDTLDDTERAAILLHEAQHLKGADEKEAYEYVWRNRKQLGWTKQTHGKSVVWRNIKLQTKEYAPQLFACDWNEGGDCTE